MAALSNNFTFSLMRGNTSSMVSRRSGQISHSLRTDLSLGAPIRKTWPRFQSSKRLICSASSASMGGSDSVFPRIRERDPYKLLGIHREAGEEEVREARSYLASQYGGDAKSMESIEVAYDKIMMEKLREYQKSQFKPKKKEIKPLPAWQQKIVGMYQVPNKDDIIKRAVFYALLGVWSVLKPGQRGPAFQVLTSFVACIYFLNDRIKIVGRSFFIGFGALVLGWVFASFLVPVIPTKILPPSWTLELTSSLVSYIFLFGACTYLR
ncbi:protein CHAPERONE-LIKE PROTEIN OF POR1, chloroplastic isoform X2 [Physcomitrium patens]|uniref:protein CHAPERONE-LIKE PROTEIN OF POR1, chloroplastic isoform X2 n=1 Tax=Physcomitrium patens TaxID=3218 RepID=UPI000D17ACC8|nr:protein CHAPERONE-LIKE PROTEIN OF POR1, chloroplastic-like isoform X2 [Physcomitrium patens]XP_024358484.1 protein CHAPERONE-LIKE PROTEIN OF POR1, chloroplastic-like isoform X2 [Physcomitrium patens]|eukprot:XP_024358483.1 protein CHAPERONE-LIKE PROTEIN OF POR1, chloroplastic-like isoform X2 [Physcomitrella patens]